MFKLLGILCLLVFLWINAPVVLLFLAGAAVAFYVWFCVKFLTKKQ